MKPKPGTRKRKVGTRPASPAGPWITPAEFVRWLPTQGVKIARKNLYETYLGKTARHPIERDASGRVHKLKALELLRVVNAREPVSAASAIAKRNEAEARIRTAEASMAEMRERKMAGTLVDIGLIQQVWMRAYENLKSTLRSCARSLALEVDGLPVLEREAVITRRHEEALRHLSQMEQRLSEGQAAS